MYNWLKRLFRRSRDPHSFDPVRPMVRPDEQRTADLERKRAAIDYTPSAGFHLDRPTCKRINMAEWRIERARRRARSTL